MKRTRKWAFVGQEAIRLAGLGMTPSQIAKRLGLHRATVFAWMKCGKVTRSPRPAQGGTAGAKTAAKWAADVRKTFAFDATDEQLVQLAQRALELADDPAESAITRLNASARFQSLSKQLLLGRTSEPPVTKPQKPAPRPLKARTGPDPRGLLHAVESPKGPAA